MTQQPSQKNHLVWFKRDLRITDHAPLMAAANQGVVLGLFLFEPGLIQSDEYGSHHHRFICEALRELIDRFRSLGGHFILRRGEALTVLETVYREWPFQSISSHAETGNYFTYSRDKAVALWCRENGIEWKEYRQDGVVRRLRTRDGWSRRWATTMRREFIGVPQKLVSPQHLGSDGLLSVEDLGLASNSVERAQAGGETHGNRCLDRFLSQRSVRYRSDMSSPLTGWNGCSRLSPYLAWGCLSLKTIVQATENRVLELKRLQQERQAVPSTWLPSLRSFQSRLRWHCHFMQKLEDEPELEFQNLCRGFDGMREDDFNEDSFSAWCRGQTGYPMVDACMRSLKRTGWLNFRMRAMLVSFASYHLWLHWRRPAVFLGYHFLDFEPGIHFSQVQMQAGTTGINTIRIYSPTKQGRDQDPTGVFIRRWVPELAGVPLEQLFEPHLMTIQEQSASGCFIGKDYPPPIVDHSTASRAAHAKVARFRSLSTTKEAARKVLAKHGSRKAGAVPRRQHQRHKGWAETSPASH